MILRRNKCFNTTNASLHHIFVVAGMLRIPLSQPQKHRIQPEGYMQ